MLLTETRSRLVLGVAACPLQCCDGLRAFACDGKRIAVIADLARLTPATSRQFTAEPRNAPAGSGPAQRRSMTCSITSVSSIGNGVEQYRRAPGGYGAENLMRQQLCGPSYQWHRWRVRTKTLTFLPVAVAPLARVPAALLRGSAEFALEAHARASGSLEASAHFETVELDSPWAFE